MSDVLDIQMLHTATGFAKIRVLNYLWHSIDGASFKELQHATHLEQTALSRHLAWLKRSGLIEDNRRRKFRQYRVGDTRTVYAILSAYQCVCDLRKNRIQESR